MKILYKVLITAGLICIGAAGVMKCLPGKNPAAEEEINHKTVIEDERQKTTDGISIDVISEDASDKKTGTDIVTVEPSEETIQSEKTAQPVLESETALESDKENILAGKIICIDAGHQKEGNSSQEPVSPGSSRTKAKVSSGTRGVATGKYEYELNLEVALKLEKALRAKEAEVYMVRDKNEVDISNVERAQLANKVGADLSLRIHADSNANSSVSGFSIQIPDGSQIDETLITTSRNIASYVNKSMTDNMTIKSRGLMPRDDLTGFNWCQVPSILVEMGFMSNPEEDQLMSTEAFQDLLVKSIVEGLEAYYSKN